MKFGTGNSNLTPILQNRQPILRYRMTTIAHTFEALSSLTGFSFFVLKMFANFANRMTSLFLLSEETLKVHVLSSLMQLFNNL